MFKFVNKFPGSERRQGPGVIRSFVSLDKDLGDRFGCMISEKVAEAFVGTVPSREVRKGHSWLSWVCEDGMVQTQVIDVP